MPDRLLALRRLRMGTMCALAPALALAACNAPSGSDTANDTAALTNTDSDVEITNEADTDDVTVVEVPVSEDSTASTSSSDTAAATEAAETASLIAAGTGITRVSHGDGYAWMRDGEIVRTASRDGKQVAYFHPGDDNPYFVQKDDRAFAMSNGKVTREFDSKGRSHTPDSDGQREAKSLSDTAQRDHKTVKQAVEHVQQQRDGQNTARTDSDQRQTQSSDQTDQHDGRSGQNSQQQQHTRTETPSKTTSTQRANSDSRPTTQPADTDRTDQRRTEQGDRDDRSPVSNRSDDAHQH
ncbi:hypothetical protein KY084_07945 [Stakelama sp. CBK3Z-3]|uniref:Lipoprotein n=1 Tax=Stakelama flava TaxID=2860338 RepID=A0ABS6XLY1_9SPHN|nr:hypothetical protein [Stakelama flava]MBW4330808.1 hypothetical protein [Stakelama flava]